MVAKSMRDATGAYDEHIAGLDAGTAAAVDDAAPECTANTEQHRGEDHGENDNEARDGIAIRKKERATEQETRGEAGLDGHAQFMQATAVLNRTVESVRAGNKDEARSEPEEIKDKEVLRRLKQLGYYRIRRNLCRQDGVKAQSNETGNKHCEEIKRSPYKTIDRGPAQDSKTGRACSPALSADLSPRDDYLLQIVWCRHGERLSTTFSKQEDRVRRHSSRDPFQLSFKLNSSTHAVFAKLLRLHQL
jgi:hypothetical protein